jgi:hypothetical protein
MAAYDAPYRVFSIALLAPCSISVGTPMLNKKNYYPDTLLNNHLVIAGSSITGSMPITTIMPVINQARSETCMW